MYQGSKVRLRVFFRNGTNYDNDNRCIYHFYLNYDNAGVWYIYNFDSKICTRLQVIDGQVKGVRINL